MGLILIIIKEEIFIKIIKHFKKLIIIDLNKIII